MAKVGDEVTPGKLHHGVTGARVPGAGGCRGSGAGGRGEGTR